MQARSSVCIAVRVSRNGTPDSSAMAMAERARQSSGRGAARLERTVLCAVATAGIAIALSFATESQSCTAKSATLATRMITRRHTSRCLLPGYDSRNRSDSVTENSSARSARPISLSASQSGKNHAAEKIQVRKVVQFPCWIARTKPRLRNGCAPRRNVFCRAICAAVIGGTCFSLGATCRTRHSVCHVTREKAHVHV